MVCMFQEMPGNDHHVWIGLGVLSACVLSLGMVLCGVFCWGVYLG